MALRGTVVCLLLKWKEVLRAVCVPSPGPSSLPLPATPGESPVVSGNAHPRLGSGAWECGGADLRFTRYCGKPAGRSQEQSSLVVKKSMGSGVGLCVLSLTQHSLAV